MLIHVGSSNGKESPTPFGSVQETFSLDSPVQDILDDKPEVFKGFKENMDTDDLFGNGWKRLALFTNVIYVKCLSKRVFLSMEWKVSKVFCGL